MAIRVWCCSAYGPRFVLGRPREFSRIDRSRGDMLETASSFLHSCSCSFVEPSWTFRLSRPTNADDVIRGPVCGSPRWSTCPGRAMAAASRGSASGPREAPDPVAAGALPRPSPTPGAQPADIDMGQAAAGAWTPARGRSAHPHVLAAGCCRTTVRYVHSRHQAHPFRS